MLVSALLLGGVLSAAPSPIGAPGLAGAHAADETDTADADAEATEPVAAEILVAPVTPVLLSSQSEAEFRVLLRNPRAHSLPEGSVELSIGDQIVSGSVSTPESSQDSESQAPSIPTIIATHQVGATASEQEQELTITVPMADLPFSFASERGVYRLYAKYIAGESSSQGSLTAYSPIVWQGATDSSASVDLTLVIPLTLPEDVLSMPTRPQLEEAIPRLDALLDTATRTRAMLAIDPRILAAIRGYGDEAPDVAREFLDRLEQSTLTSFTLQYGDADPAAQAELGFSSLLAPNGLEYITRFGSWESTEESAADAGDTAADATEPDTTASDTANADTANTDEATTDTADTDTPATVDTAADPVTGEPTLAALGEWPNGVSGAWPAAGQVSDRAMQLLRDSGYDLTVLSSANVTLTGGSRATLGGDTAVITDSELDSSVRLALQGATETERELGEAQAHSRLVLAASTGVTGLVVGVDRAGSADFADTAEVLDALTSERWVQTVALDAQPEGTATLLGASPDEERLADLQTAVENESVVLETRALLVHPEYLDSYQRMRLLTLFATRYASPEVDFAAVSSAYSERDAELREGVSVVSTKKAQLVGVSSRIPIQLRNPLPFDAVVNLSANPTSAALSMPEREFTEILLAEDSSEGVLVPVRSRVSSGEASILLSVTSVDGEHTSSSDVLPVSISTSLETIAIVILIVAAGLLFGFGIWRSVRRRREASGE